MCWLPQGPCVGRRSSTLLECDFYHVGTSRDHDASLCHNDTSLIGIAVIAADGADEHAFRVIHNRVRGQARRCCSLLPFVFGSITEQCFDDFLFTEIDVCCYQNAVIVTVGKYDWNEYVWCSKAKQGNTVGSQIRREPVPSM